MYEYLCGLITLVQPRYIALEVNGIGYHLMVANPYRYHVDTQTPVKLFVYQAVRDDDISLFGFNDLDEKNLFLQLINVSGIGPKSALAILANPDHQGLIDAITNNDVAYLTKFPGIGKKTASQICLDLRDKLAAFGSTTDLLTAASGANSETMSRELQDALEALQALGYKERDVKKVAKQLRTLDKQATEDYLRAALRILN